MNNLARGWKGLACGLWICTFVAACNSGSDAAATYAGSELVKAAESKVFEGPVPRATCGTNDKIETGLQGQVSLADRMSGRSIAGYNCNMELLGQYQGEGTSWVSQSIGDCAYLSTHFPGSATSPGTQVVDVSDPGKPVLSTNLATPGMLGTWESSKVNAARGLLAGTFASSPGGNGPLFVSARI